MGSIELINEHTERQHITKHFTIDAFNTELELTKWYDDDDINGFDADWEWETSEYKKLFEALTEEQQDEILDFINNQCKL